MISQERRAWLLGEKRPVRVIPSGFVATRADAGDRLGRSVEPADHTPLRDLLIDRSHPAWIEGAHVAGIDHNEHLHHLDESGVSHYLVVSSANRAALDRHLDSVSIWMLATPAVADGPHPIHLREVVAQAVLEMTGRPVADLLAEPREETHVHYHDLLGDDIAAVRDHAGAILADALGELASAGVIDSEDLDAIDSEQLIGQFLRVRAEHPQAGAAFVHDRGHAAQLEAHPGAVLTRFGPLEPGHDLAFSIRDIGSVPKDDWVYWTTSTEYASVSETLSTEQEITAELWGLSGNNEYPGSHNGTASWLVDNDTVETGKVTCSLPSCKWKLGLYGEQESSVEVKGNAFTFSDP